MTDIQKRFIDLYSIQHLLRIRDLLNQLDQYGLADQELLAKINHRIKVWVGDDTLVLENNK